MDGNIFTVSKHIRFCWHPQSQGSVERANADIKEMISWMNDNDTTPWSEGLRFVQFQKIRSHHRVIDQPPYKALFGADPQIGLSSSSIPKELLPQLETEEDLEQILADAGEGDTTDGTTDDDESAISTDISEAYVMFVVTTVQSFSPPSSPFLHHDLSPIMTYYRILNKNNTVGLSLGEQKLLPLKKYEVSRLFRGHGAQLLTFCVLYC
jgi:hypothetical protein